MKIYNNETIEILNKEIKNIENAGKKARLDIIDPSMEEYNNVVKVILDYIKENKRIIYGGRCWEALLQNKNKKEYFYKNYDLNDYEFYSYEPIKDMVEISDILHKKGFKYIRSTHAQHNETYKIAVNFHEYCDITYMPKILFNKMKKIEIDNLLYCPFNFIMIDILRIFNDPISSYWRLEKNAKRAFKLMQYYNLNLDPKFTKLEYNTNQLDFIRKEIIINSKLINIGYYAFNYYKHIALDKNEELYVPYYEVISINYVEDIKAIYKKISSKFDNTTKIEYHPFFQFFDKKTSIFINKKLVMIIYNNNNKCIPYKFLENKKIYIASYNIILMYLLMNELYYCVNNNQKEKKNVDYLIQNLIELRNRYLNKYNKTPIDETPFQEFFTDCKGKTSDPQKDYFKSCNPKHELFNFKNKVTYQPNNNNIRNKENLLKKMYNNTSGNVIN